MLPQNDINFRNLPKPKRRSKKAINIKILSTKIGKSKGTIYNWINPKSPYYIPSFPRPIKIGKRSVAWIEEEIDDFLTNLTQSRDQNGD